MWITDGISTKKIKKTDPIPEGWKKGRKLYLLEKEFKLVFPNT